MTTLRVIACILCTIIFVKSLHCAVVESVRSTDANNPSQPIGGCDAGCMCKGAVFIRPVELNTDDAVERFSPQGYAAVGIRAEVESRVGNVAHYLRGLDGARIYGRALRALISSLTL